MVRDEAASTSLRISHGCCDGGIRHLGICECCRTSAETPVFCFLGQGPRAERQLPQNVSAHPPQAVRGMASLLLFLLRLKKPFLKSEFRSFMLQGTPSAVRLVCSLPSGYSSSTSVVSTFSFRLDHFPFHIEPRMLHWASPPTTELYPPFIIYVLFWSQLNQCSSVLPTEPEELTVLSK